MFEKSLEEEIESEPSGKAQGPVECLGMTFPNDEARREYFLEKLREKLQDPEFRNIKGFPLGEDEDILRLSDPPYYTPCPNPFLEEFIQQNGRPYDSAETYDRAPYATDVSEGKTDSLYNAHSYHTKVPHKAIMRYILHYTEPGDVVFDGFCGTGMTGVAAQLCGDKAAVQSLGYRVRPDGTLVDENGGAFSKLGPRHAILNDLSPAATFIAHNYNTPVDAYAIELAAKRILKEVEDECGWMYETKHVDGSTIGRINYTVWSDVFVCPVCTNEVTFWEAAVDREAYRVFDEFPCPQCAATLTKRQMEHARVSRFDKALNQTIRQAKQVPVLIKYRVGNKRFEKAPDNFDLALIEAIENSDIPYRFPIDRMPEGEESRRNDDIGITHAHHFFTRRNLWTLAKISGMADYQMKLVFQSIVATLCSRLVRYNMGKRGNGPLSGTLYVSSLNAETEITSVFRGKTDDFKRALVAPSNSLTSTQSSSDLQTPSNSLDYIFTDPPFGGNLMYSELNFLWESWLKVFTNSKPEAIANRVQGKGLPEYQRLMTECFKEYYRVLKPGRWMTVEFHNSKNAVWNAIQEALQAAGFVIADVRTLDKQQGTFKQVTAGGAVKQDLIISAYKPSGALEERFKLEAGSEEGAWDFIRTHLRHLPVFVSKDDQVEAIAERQNFLLFDRMVAFHIQRGVLVPISAAEFYAGLEQRFPERDGMYFLPEQVAEYDRKRMTVKQVLQLQLFVIDESSAILWLKQQLLKKPQTFQELHPQFMREIGGWQKHEIRLELLDLLNESFLRYEGSDEVPSQVHSYLSSNFRELRNLPKEDSSLRSKGKDRWYVPDPGKAQDLERLRERTLLREFEEYRQSNQRKLRVFRVEAIRAGFKKAWQERDYTTIIAVAGKIPENVLQEDPKLLMWYDQAVTRVEG